MRMRSSDLRAATLKGEFDECFCLRYNFNGASNFKKYVRLLVPFVSRIRNCILNLEMMFSFGTLNYILSPHTNVDKK
jgi:hypothetical protein